MHFRHVGRNHTSYFTRFTTPGGVLREMLKIGSKLDGADATTCHRHVSRKSTSRPGVAKPTANDRNHLQFEGFASKRTAGLAGESTMAATTSLNPGASLHMQASTVAGDSHIIS